MKNTSNFARRTSHLLTKSVLVGLGLGLGIVASLALAVTVGTVKTWTTGETLTAADLNSTITSLKTALEAIPNWTKSGTAAVYTDGNVGIGTTAPVGILHVKSSTNALITLDATSGYPEFDLSRAGTTDAMLGVANGIDQFVTGTTAGDMGIRVQNNDLFFSMNGGTTPHVVIRNTGNVGIGTTIPAGPLHIVGATGGTWATIFGNTDDGTGDTYIRGSKAASRIWIGDNNTGSVLIANTGNVGIGTATPGYPLTMGSGAYVTTGGVWTNASSREYKENLEALTAEEALAAVMALDPQKFSYKKDKCPSQDSPHPNLPPQGGKGSNGYPSKGEGKTFSSSPLTGEDSGGGGCSPEQYIGFVAEDVPALVATNDRKGLSAMDLVAVLTKVVQEQQERINELTERVVELERN